MTRSEELLSRVRTLAARCLHGALSIAALELADEYEIAVEHALRVEATIHEITKAAP